MMIIKFIARYLWAVIFGALLANSGFMPFQTWQYWAWFIQMLIAIFANDWAVKS